MENDQVEVDLLAEDGKLGAITDDSLRVTAILAGGAADGKLFPGDVILTVNGEQIKSRDQLESLMLSPDSVTKIKLSRSSAGPQVDPFVDVDKNQMVPSEFENLRISGYDNEIGESEETWSIPAGQQ
ncbi:unnamed protein product [Anisakis simplex]|uniref:PDZ domain-containing protein n=1 Tax=Anisakis simplex TaxID=6269 RepID=A0A0M3J023_ANISI|nr:unnamed protein product [Anisakis simplex]